MSHHGNGRSDRIQMDDSRSKSLLVTFQRELDHTLNSSREHISNRLFSLLSKYESKLNKPVYQHQLLKLGDDLRSMKHYNLAMNHGYGRYLRTLVTDPSNVLCAISVSETEIQLSLTLRAIIGKGYCEYYAVICVDELFKVLSTRELGIAILQNMELCIQAGLQYENLYWLVYNAVTLSYCVARNLLRINLHKHVLKPLIWNCVAMESCIPLLTVKYLPLRARLYFAVCACYYALQQPSYAELFARKSLDKIHQLAQIESMASTGIVQSNSIFTEATLKLGVMVFKRTVLEAHKKTKSVLRPKVRPTIKDLLQSNWPRSSTEKLLDEMFNGHSAHFLAILEALSINSASRPLDRKAPQPVTELDEETITDVFQELLTAGVDLSLKALEHIEKCESLLSLAVKGSDSIPVSSVVKFIHLCYQLDCVEAVSLLAPVVVTLEDASTVSIKILLAADELYELVRQGSEDKKIWDKCVTFLDFISTVPLENPVNNPIIHNLLFDSSLIVWERIGDVYRSLISSNSTAFRPLIGSSKFLELLRKVILLFCRVSMPFFDPVLHCEVVLKYVLLLEAYIDLPLSSTHKQHQGLSFVCYDRDQLFSCLNIIECSMRDISLVVNESNLLTSVLKQCHTELFNSLWRVKAKLLSTTLPARPTDSFKKPSMLPHMVKERQLKLQAWEEIAAKFCTSSTIPTEAELRAECGVDHHQMALLLINLAVCSPEEKKVDYIKDAVAQLSSFKMNESTTDASASSSIPHAPILLKQSPTEMTFIPAPFSNADVAYYALYGCIATSRNSKVRLSDRHLTGLGTEVTAQTGCILQVSGLRPYSKYIFAVAAYSLQGQLLGDTIGLSTRPILASYPMCDSFIWGLVSQTSYQLGSFAIALKSSDVLWHYFVDVQPFDNSSVSQYCLKEKLLEETPLPLLHLFTTNVLIFVQASMKDSNLCHTSSFKSLISSERKRMNLIERLWIALKVSAKINDHCLSQQVVVLLYVLLVPFIQEFTSNHRIIEVLLLCHAVLQELPDNLLTSKSVIIGIHHMISSLSFFLVKAFSSYNESALVSSLVDSTRFLLTLTLPSNVSTHHRVSSANASSLQNPSLLSSTSTALTSTFSFASQSSLMPLAVDKSTRQQRRKRRKALTLNDDIPDEAKSLQYKALGAYFMCTLETKAVEDLDLTGQEDPVFLHIAIKSLPVHAAYKEVVKFKRRPQYLEYFVHLCEKVMKEGKGELILNWSVDVFSWLAKRNEVLLSTKTSQIHKPDQPKEPPMPSKNHLTQVAVHSGSSRQQHCVSSESSRKGTNSAGTSHSKSVHKAETCLAVLKQRITRDDLSAKAVAVLQNLLSSLWRVSHCRKRLRLACTEEHSWRAKANMILASCVLDRVCNLLKVDSSLKYCMLDANGFFLDGVLLAYSPCIPSKERKDFHSSNEEQVSKLLQQMFTHYQRAAVLSSRGECWILLVNVCRGLWNGLTVLHNAICKTNTSTVDLHQLYGLSLKALYMLSLLLMDMHKFGKANQTYMHSERLYSDTFLKQMVLLAIHVSFINHHWEKVLVLSETILSILNVGDILNPVVMKAQQQLSQRIKSYAECFQDKPIEPAAHLDIFGYDLYDKVGHSLGMTNVSLHNKVHHSSTAPDKIVKEKGEVLLSQAHKLLAELLNGHVISDDDVPLAVVKQVCNSYSIAIAELTKSQRVTSLAIQCMHILGNLMYLTGQLKLAGYWWKLGLKKAMNCDNPLKEWKCSLEGINEEYCYIIGGILSSNLARYVHATEINIRLDYTLLAARLFKSFMQHFSILTPKKDINYAGFKVAISNILECKVFTYCDTSCLLSSLHCIAKELVNCCYSLEVMPVVCFYEYVAYSCARSVQHTALARMYKLQALVQLAFFNNSFKLLLNLTSGNQLPHLTSEFNFSMINYSVSYDFDDQSFINSNQNLKFLSFVTEKPIPVSLKEVYGSLSYLELILCKATLFIQLAVAYRDIPDLKPEWQKIQPVGNTTISYIKAVLLSSAEKLLYELLDDNTNTCHLTICIRSHQLLIEIALALCQGLTATKLSLTTLRIMQRTSCNFDPRLWLYSRVLLMKSLIQMLHNHDNPLNYLEFFSAACKECLTYGDCELNCHLLYISAFYHYIAQPPALEDVTFFSQTCLDKLNGVETLSSAGKLLKSNVMLLMAEVMSRSTSQHEVKKVYNGVIKNLNCQLQDISKNDSYALVDNCYKHQLQLIVEAHLRLIQLEFFDEINLCSVNTLLERIIGITKHMASSCNSMLSVLMYTNSLLLIKSEKLSSSMLTEALSYALPFDYTLLHKTYFLFAQVLASCCSHLEVNLNKCDYSYHGWCATKFAADIHHKVEKLQYFSSELHSNDTALQLPSVQVPDAILLDFCDIAHVLESLVTTTKIPQLVSLLPFSQNFTSSKVSWFGLLGNFQLILKQAFLSEDTLNCHLHHFTPLLLPKAKVLFNFLLSCCPKFSHCVPRQSLTSIVQGAAVGSETHCDPCLMAGEKEVTILWTKNAGDQVQGLVALNGKAVHGFVSSSSLHQMEIEVHTISMSGTKLNELRKMWHDLAVTCANYLTQQAVRPLSRSPSRMKQRTLEQVKQVPPSDLMESIKTAVAMLLDAFNLSKTLKNIPHLEAHMISSIERVLRPAVVATEKGDAYLFFKKILSNK